MNDKEVIYSKRSALNLIEVVKSTKPGFEGKPELYLNHEPYLYSYYPHENFSKKDIFNICCVLPLMGNVKNVLILGLGPGTMLTKMRHFYKELIFDAVEIDPEIVRVGYEYFGLEKSPLINIIISDAREFLESTDNSYDLVIIDVFKEGRIPYHLSTYEFFRLIKNHLNKKGILFLNLSNPIYNNKICSIAKTVGKVFPSVFLIPHPSLLGFKERIFLWNLKRYLKKSNRHPALEDITKWVMLQIRKFHWRIQIKYFLIEILKTFFKPYCLVY